MKRILLLLAVLSIAGGVSAQTVEELIAKNIQARGGMDRIRAIKTTRMTAKFYGGGIEAQYVQENKRSDSVREELLFQRLTGIQAYDGKVGWQIQPFGGRMDPELLGEDDLRGMKQDGEFDGPLVDYQEKGSKVEYFGREDVDGSDAFKIKVTQKNGDIRMIYLDVDAYLEVKEEIQRFVRGAVHESEVLMGSYKPVAGVMYPFLIESGAKGSQDKQKLAIEKIEVNIPLDDSRFAPPASLRPAK
jgi:hypothetical protein